MTEASLRLFAALELPPTVRDELQAALAGVPPELATGLRWVRPDAWHLTLVFLGAVRPAQLGDLTARLGRAAARGRPVELQVSGSGRFGRQVLWAGVTGDLLPLRRLAQSASAAGRRAGITVDDRPYRAHLTLARSTGAADLRAVCDALGELRTSPWSARDLVLVRSHLGAGAGGTSRYEVAGRWPLGGTDSA